MATGAQAPRLEGWLAAAFVVSGTAALMLEVVWNRRLHLVFGGSAVATASVLAAYMGGLAAGSFWVAPWVRARWHPALAYGVMELAVGAYALAVAPLLAGMGQVQDMLGAGGGSGVGGAALRFALCGAVLLVPTAMMGATLPCLADLVPAGGQGAGKVGLLYAANTAGAVVGTLLATFVAFPMLHVEGTNLLAAGLDAVAATVALFMWVRLGRPGPVRVSAADRTASPTLARTPPVLWVYGLTGAVAMALEVCWARSLSMVLGSSIHAFSLMLAAFLAGLALGARLAVLPAVSRRPARLTLAAVLVATAAVAFAGTWLVDALPWVMYAAARVDTLTPWMMWAGALACSCLVMLPAAVGFGAVLPLTLVAARLGTGPLGALVGRAYAINTVGAITGSLAAGFVLVPQLGLDVTAHALCALLAGVGALMLAGSHRRRAAAVVMVGAALSTAWGGYDVARWSVGAFRVYLSRSVWHRGLPPAEVIFRKDGLNTTVTVEEAQARVSLKVNGKTDASSEGDMPTQVLSGLLPVLLHPNPRTACVVGFGSGVTSDALLSYPGLTALDMVELEPAVVQAGELFAAVNHRPWEDARYRGHFDDGRHHLGLPAAPYDIIISEPSNPWITGASNLFTREFWTLASRRLGPDGVFLQWVQLYELDQARIRSLMGTFRSVFPNVLVFAAHPESNDTLLVGSNQPLVLRESRLRQLYETPSIRRQLKRADVHTPLDVAALILMDGPRLDAFVQDAVMNTDNNMYVELNAPGDLVAYSVREPELPFLAPLSGKRLPLVESTLAFLPGWDVRARRLALADVFLRAGLTDDMRATVATLVGEGAPYEAGRSRLLAALEVLEGDDEMPVITPEGMASSDQRYVRAVGLMMQDRDSKALESLEPFEKFETTSPDHRLLKAWLVYRADQRWRSLQIATPLLFAHAWRRNHPEGTYYLARIHWLNDENQWAARLALELVDAKDPERARGVRAATQPPVMP